MKKVTHMTCATVGGQAMVIMEVAGEEPAVYDLGRADDAEVRTTDDLKQVQAAVDRVLDPGLIATDGVCYTSCV